MFPWRKKSGDIPFCSTLPEFKMRQLALSERASNLVTWLYPRRDLLTVPELLEAQREQKQSSGVYLVHTPDPLGSPWPGETGHHSSHCEKTTRGGASG